MAEPHNLAPGWVGFDNETALGCPVKLVNVAEMQALGSYKGGKMLFRAWKPGSGPLWRGQEWLAKMLAAR